MIFYKFKSFTAILFPKEAARVPSHVRVPTLLTHPERLSAMVKTFERIIDFAIRVRREDVTTQQSLDFAHAAAPRRQDFDQPDISKVGQ